MKFRVLLCSAWVAGCLVNTPGVRAQNAVQPSPPASPASAQQAAPFDLTGYWVSVVMEDWRWRMLTPPKGDYASVPLSDRGRQEADTWTEAEDGSCKAYGAAGLMRMPTRLHITWASPNVLKIETDWGEQVRLFDFSRGDAADAVSPSLQGSSFATWERPARFDNSGAPPDPNEPPPPGGYLKVATTHLAPAWLRRNGVPYGAKTQLTEYFRTFTDPLGREWFNVTVKVVDPEHLSQPFITSSDFRREPDGSKWAPHPCRK